MKLQYNSRPKRFQHRTEKCLNCDRSLDISDGFCSYCGQKNTSKALTLKELVLEYFSGLVSYDSRFRKTISAMMFNPGELSKKYIEGKRVSYVNPFRFFISTAIIFFLVVSWINRDELNSIKSINGYEVEESSDALDFDFGENTVATKFQEYANSNPNANYSEAIEATGVENTYYNQLLYNFLIGYSRIKDNPKDFVNFLLPKLPFFLFFFVPIFTLFSTLFYIRRKIPYTHHLIFNYNQQTVFLILLFLAFIIDFIQIRIWLLIYIVYLYKSMRKFYSQARLKTIFKQVVIMTCYSISSILVLTSLALLSIIFF